MSTKNPSTNAFRLDPGSDGAPAPAFTSRTALAAVELSTTVHVLAVGEAFSVSTHDVAKGAVSCQPSAVSPAASTEIREAAGDTPALRVHQPNAEKRPLSSFTNQFHEPSPLGMTSKTRQRSAGALQAATTVSAFRWPRVCQMLSSNCANRFQGAVDALLARADKGQSLIGVLGLDSGHGCTTTLLCLAQQLAASNRRVIVVDANFAAPHLAASLGVELRTWQDRSPDARVWQDVLERGVPIAAAVVHSKSDRIDLLPLDDRPTNGPRLAAGLQPAITAGVLLDAYDLVLVDLGAILEPLSQAAILELVRNMRMDAAVAVTGPGPTDPHALDLVGQLLSQRGCELLGTIENRVPGLPVAEG
jgi:Mrp family chromosome partitioning ATPase